MVTAHFGIIDYNFLLQMTEKMTETAGVVMIGTVMTVNVTIENVTTVIVMTENVTTETENEKERGKRTEIEGMKTSLTTAGMTKPLKPLLLIYISV